MAALVTSPVIVELKFRRGKHIILRDHDDVLEDDRASTPFIIRDGKHGLVVHSERSGEQLTIVARLPGDESAFITYRGAIKHQPKRWQKLVTVRNQTRQRWTCYVKVTVVQPKRRPE